jgi:hypothetical protein
MSNIDKFTEEERLLLVSLPYRVGMWLSEADDEEGEHDDEQEMEALEEILVNFSGSEAGTPMTREIAGHTLKSREKWAE